MKKTQRVYLKQKIDLYFDEHFPAEIIDKLKNDNYWKRRCRVYSVYDFGNQNKDDQSQFEFCKNRGYTLRAVAKSIEQKKLHSKTERNFELLHPKSQLDFCIRYRVKNNDFVIEPELSV